jgi:predicted DNA-binding transcriptional regulator YafY
MADSEYQSVERVLLLLLCLLNSGQEGITRQEIYQQIESYQKAPSESAQRRIFERDIRQLEQVGFHISRERGGRGHDSLYSARI